MKKNIAVLYGGRSGEHEVSLLSAASVVRYLSEQKYEVSLVGISMNGSWYLQDASLVKECRGGQGPLCIQEDEAKRVVVLPGAGSTGCFRLLDGSPLALDVVFPVLHGSYGEDGTIQGLFEMAGIAYVGAPVLGSALGMDKDLCKAVWLQYGLPVVPYKALRKTLWQDPDEKARFMAELEKDFSYPIFVKPCCAGSSVGASKVPDAEHLEAAVQEAFEWDDKIMLEPFIRAREIECSVTGNDKVEVYTPGEIVPHHEFYDYDAKYIDPDGAALLIPADLPNKTLEAVRQLTIQAYTCLELNGLARMDFFLDKDSGEILLNEVNTMPGFTHISMFPKLCEASGLPYPMLLEKLILLAEERYTERSKRSYKRRGT